MYDPLLQHRPPTIVCIEGAREPAAIRRLAVFHRGSQVAGGCPGLCQDILAVAGVHRRVPIGVEHNGWDGVRPVSLGKGVPAPPCRMAAKAEGMSRAAPQARPECTPTAA